MRGSLHTLNLAILGLILAACSNIEHGDANTLRLARVGSHYLNLDEARAKIPPFLMKQDSIDALQRYREKWIRNQLLLQEAAKLQLTQQQDVKKRLKQAHDEVLLHVLREVIIAQFDEQLTVSNQEISNYYQQYKDQLILPERYVQFRHVETLELSEARNARSELEDEVPWPVVARKYSLNAEKEIQKATDFWPVSTVLNDVPVMKRYVATLDSGAISPIQRQNGVYHFIQLTNVHEQGDYSDQSWVSDELKKWLLIEKRHKHYNSYVKNLYFKAKEDNEIDLFNVLSSNTKNLDTTETKQSNE